MKYLPLIFLFISFVSNAQDEIFLRNPSFEEGAPRLGRTPLGWYNCGAEGESEVDVFPVRGNSFKVDKTAFDGEQYVGMVVRENQTWEAIGQQLPVPLKGGKIYALGVFLARSPMYMSLRRSGSTGIGKAANYATPCKLRVWGGNSFCKKRATLGGDRLNN